MEETRSPEKAWSKPLLSWPDVFALPILIGVWFLLTAVVAIASSPANRPPNPAQIFWVFGLNGVVWAVASAKSSTSWLALRKYAKWKVTCDENGVSLVTHRGDVHLLPWSQFKGYALSKRSRGQFKIVSMDGDHDITVPMRGHRFGFQPTIELLVRTLDNRLPVGGVRVRPDESRLRLPKWLAWSLIAVSLPLLGVPMWALWLNGFSVTTALLIEALSRSSGLVLPLLLLGPLVLATGCLSLLRARKERKQDTTPGKGLGLLKFSSPPHKGHAMSMQLLMGGTVLIVLTGLPIVHSERGLLADLALVAMGGVGLYVATREFNLARQRVLITDTHLILRQGRREWVYPHGSYLVDVVQLPRTSGPLSRRIHVRSGSKVFMVFEQWSDGDWLSRALLRTSEQIGQV